MREAWAHDAEDLDQCRAFAEDLVGGGLYVPYFRATETALETLRWRPSLHMPRWASRILLEITEVRVERLQDISEGDAIAEGIEPNWSGDLKVGLKGFGGEGWMPDCGWCYYLNSFDGEPAYTAFESYSTLWRAINGDGAWAANPWVWVVSFRMLPRTGSKSVAHK